MSLQDALIAAVSALAAVVVALWKKHTTDVDRLTTTLATVGSSANNDLVTEIRALRTAVEANHTSWREMTNDLIGLIREARKNGSSGPPATA